MVFETINSCIIKSEEVKLSVQYSEDYYGNDLGPGRINLGKNHFIYEGKLEEFYESNKDLVGVEISGDDKNIMTYYSPVNSEYVKVFSIGKII